MKTVIATNTFTTFRGSLTHEDLRELYNAAKPKDAPVMPDNVKFHVVVPSGADYSGEDLYIGDDIDAVQFTWTVEERTTPRLIRG